MGRNGITRIHMKAHTRIKYVPVDYTEDERRKMKEEFIEHAMAWVPPTYYYKEVYLEPGDEGYGDAPYVLSHESSKKFPLPSFND